MARTSGLHGDSRIDEASLSPSPEERVVRVPAKLLEEVGFRLLRRVRIRVWRGLGQLAEVARPKEPGSEPDERPPPPLDPAALAEAAPLPLPLDPAWAATALPPSAPSEPAPPSAIGPVALAAPPVPSAYQPLEAAPARPETITIEADVFDRIRIEIKSRLPYFQACADAARRRGVPDVRRLQATWVIADDGSIKDLKLEGVKDAQLATCVTRMGSRPFPVSPGTELTIPTPIVFVR